MADAVIQVEGLSKRFGEVVAVDGISFSIAPGTVTALLGGNGAGKTTTLGMIMGLVTPTAGRIHVMGVDMLRHPQAALAQMNFSSPYVDLPGRLTVEQLLVTYGRLYGVRGLKARIAELARDLDLGELMARRYSTLSAGQKTRAALAQSLINRRRLLLLDEPTAALDPVTGDWVRRYLSAYQERHGAAILLASHNMVEVERRACDVLMMQKGRMVDRGAPVELLARYGRTTMEAVFLAVARGEAMPDITEPVA
jgi:ABC-2 type transport system ATP-binding protein